MTPPLMISAAAQKLTTAWGCLAVAALGLSTVPAAVLLIGYAPFLDIRPAILERAFVLHSTLAMPVWLLALVAAITANGASRAGVASWGGWWLAVAGVVAIMVSPMLGGKAIAASYLPLLDNVFFLGGLGTFLLAVGATTSGALGRLRQIAGGGAAGAAIAWLLPALAATLTLVLVGVAGADSVEGLTGPLAGIGVAFQGVCGLLLLAAWMQTAGDSLPGIAAHRRVRHGLCGLAMLPVVAAVAVSGMFPASSVEYRESLAWLSRWTLWPAPALLATILVRQLALPSALRRLTAEQKGLGLSLLLFAVGWGSAVVFRDTDFAPAPLHGTLGAITLACLFFRHRLPAQRASVAALRSAFVYGWGTLVFVIALGITQTVAGTNPAAYFAMGAAAIGGFAAIAGAFAYALIAMADAFGLAAPLLERKRRDLRPWAIAITLLLVVCGGWLLQSVPRSNGFFSSREHAAAQIKADIETRFRQGIVMLHAKQYEHALTAFHRVLQLAPEMPEAHVNMGFALIGLKRYKEAADFFESATQLRPNQTNAYYGLAVAQEGMGNLRGAVEAMEAYVHLARADDPFLPKARAAIWEWRTALENAKAESNPG